MFDLQVAGINECTGQKEEQAQPVLLALPKQDCTSARNDEQLGQILCCYVNATDQLQIARSEHSAKRRFERVVFPGERLLFTALPSAQIEIYITEEGTEIVKHKITCKYLRVLA